MKSDILLEGKPYQNIVVFCKSGDGKSTLIKNLTDNLCDKKFTNVFMFHGGFDDD